MHHHIFIDQKLPDLYTFLPIIKGNAAIERTIRLGRLHFNFK